MKVAAIFGEKQGGLVDKPDPKPHGDVVVVKVRVVPMCTEIQSVRGGASHRIIGA